MAELTLFDRLTLCWYIKFLQNDLQYTGDRDTLLKRLRNSGIAISRLEELSTNVQFNPAHLKFNSVNSFYFAKRIELAYTLLGDLQKKGQQTSIDKCYSAIDKLVTEEYDGKYGGEAGKGAYEVLRLTRSIIKKPQQKVHSFENRLDVADGLEVPFGSLMIGALEGIFAYGATMSIPYTVFATAAGLVGGFVLSVYIDTWGNYDLVAGLRKLVGTDTKDTTTILENRLAKKKQLYDRLCELATQ